MRGSEYSELPVGTWVFIQQVPYDATDESLAAFLYEHGLAIDADRIQIKNDNRDGRTSAIISVPNDVLIDLLHWAINNDSFNGFPMQFRTSKSRQK